MKILKSYNAPKEALKTFYVAVVRSEYGAKVWNGGLTMEQSEDIERIQKRALRIMYQELKYGVPYPPKFYKYDIINYFSYYYSEYFYYY
jgi:hypothetical protein